MHPLTIVRPAQVEDLQELYNLARVAGVGLTTLPADRGVLLSHLRDSERAFEMEVESPRGERYLFVLEDPIAGRLLGTAGIVSRVGGFEPFYSYNVASTRLRSKALGVDRELRYLQLEARHQGPSEIGTLFLHPSARGGGSGRLLSLSRFAFMHAFPERFAAQVIAEMRGVVDAQGQSPFWEAVGQHFFAIPFAEADTRSASDKSFIADLMPKHPLYLDMLPPEAQAVVGAVHHDTVPAKALLRSEGFQYAQQVDIFDAGPMMEAQRAQIRVIQQAKVAPLLSVQREALEGPLHLISNRKTAFRAAIGVVRPLGDGVVLARDLALALQLRLGDPVYYVPARPADPGAVAQLPLEEADETPQDDP